MRKGAASRERPSRRAGLDSPRELHELWPWQHAGIEEQRRLDDTFETFRIGPEEFMK